MQYYSGLLIGLEIQISQLFSVAHPVVFQMRLFMALGICQVHAAVLVCSHCTCLIVLSELWDIGATKVLCRMLRLSGARPAMWSRTRDVPRPLQSFDEVDVGS